MSVVYHREPHAAHCMFTGRPLHDLETWDCVLPAYYTPRPKGVPSDADRDYGCVIDGQQHVYFRRRAPVTAKTNCTCKEPAHV